MVPVARFYTVIVIVALCVGSLCWFGGMMYGKKEQQARDADIAIIQQRRINEKQATIIDDLRSGDNILLKYAR